jgi:hypothetical protein
MTTRNKPRDGSQIDGVTILSTRASMGTAANDYAAWLDQATRARDKAFRCLQDRFIKDVGEAAQFAGCIDSNALARQMEYATKLTADYLAESEKMFELMSMLARSGWLESRKDSCGHRVGNTEEPA